MISELVKETCETVSKLAEDVKINEKALDDLCEEISKDPVYVDFFGCPGHIEKSEDDEKIAAFIFIIDALNFCFWPAENNWEYADLSQAVKDALKDPDFSDPQKLSQMTMEKFKEVVFKGEDFPLIEERLRAIQELGNVVFTRFCGKFINVLEATCFDATILLDTIVKNFLKFQDHTIYKGQQIFLYKRAQILVGDLWGAFKEKPDSRQIQNIDKLTCFADYRIPQILRHKGVLEYSEKLAALIDEKKELTYGSPEEVEIRACMVHSVELLRDKLKAKEVKWCAVEVDWLLWQIGEKQKDEIKPHHRTLSIFY